ncbi:hypothetical protein FS837_007974 [Tulasnella sp. UAMH 9824]|nr:hypothetical protein FS837_007974 [Tulasnella sp. UAMH 9824]
MSSSPAMGRAVHRVSLEKAPDTASVSGFSSSLSPLPLSPSSPQPVQETFIDQPPAAAPLPAMASCAQTPTETVYSTFLSTTGGVVTLTSTSIITGAPSTETSFSTACIASAADGTCSEFTTETITSTIPGDDTTSTILQTITGDTTITTSVPVQTLYAPCDDTTQVTRTKTTTTTTTPRDSPTPDRNPSTPTPTPSPSQSLGQPTTVTQIVVVTAPNGQLSTSASISTQTPTLSATDAKAKSGANVGMIVGGVIAGFFGLILLGGLIWYCLKRRQAVNWDDIFDKDEGYEEEQANRRRSMNLLENEPKPYEYGVVGAHAAPGPPHSPGPGQMHGRTPSMAPLLLPGAGSESEHMRDGTTSTRSSMRYSAHQSSNNTLSSFSYPPAQSPPFLQTNFPNHGPPAGSASSRNPSQSSRLSYPASTSAHSAAGLSQGHGRSSSVGQIIPQPRSPPLSEASLSQYSDQTVATSTGASAGPSFAVQRKGRPQSYNASGIALPAIAPPPAGPIGPSLTGAGNVPPPAYEPGPVSKRASGSIDSYAPYAMQGQRLALANPDAAGPSPTPPPAKQFR